MSKPPNGLDAAGRALWRRVVADLTERELLRKVDVDAIERYVVASMIARQALDRLRVRESTQGADAWLMRATHGGWTEHADVRIWKESTRLANALAGDLGLTPKARHAMRDTSASDELDAWISDLRGGKR